MHYLVKGESIEEVLAGKTPDEMSTYVAQIIKPSLEALWKLAEEKKIVGVVAGAREHAFVLDAESNADVGRLLRGLPFWGATRWTVSPLQSFQSALEQNRETMESTRPMVVER